MIWYIWLILAVVSLAMITIGLTKPSESSQAIIGFLFLFLLSFVILGNNLEYETGYTEDYIYGDDYDGYHYDDYNGTPSPAFGINLFHTNRTYTYATWNDTTGIITTHRFGYFLAVASIIGFIGVLTSVKGWTWGKEE